MALKNNFGWSFSRENTFDSCQRRYYFHYYLSWGGWKVSAPDIVRKAFALKRLVTMSLWRGQLVHYIASKILQSMRAKGRIPFEEDVVRYTKDRFKEQLSFSREKRYLSEPKKSGGKLNIDWLALFEHEYGEEISSKKIEKTSNEVIDGVRNLLSSRLLSDIMETDTSEWIIEDIDFAEFAQSLVFQGVKIYVKTDFIFRGDNGRLEIVDWKTYRHGIKQEQAERRDPESDQLGIYAYYAASELSEPAENIELIEVNLLDNASEKRMSASQEGLARAERRLKDGISKLSAKLSAGDTERNEPLSIDHFIPNSGPACRYCNFKRICESAAL